MSGVSETPSAYGAGMGVFTHAEIAAYARAGKWPFLHGVMYQGSNTSQFAKVPVTANYTPVTMFRGKTPVSISITRTGSISSAHGAVVFSDGTMYTWGANGSGQLGRNDTAEYGVTLFPTAYQSIGQVAGSNWASVSCGEGYTMAIKTDGSLWAVGAGTSGKLGNNSSTGSSVWIQPGGGAGTWSKVYAGTSHTLAIRTDGNLYAWGSNASGMTGLSTSSGSTIWPALVGSASDVWTTAAVGNTCSAAIKNGNVYTWGNNQYGRTGTNTVSGSYTFPTQITTDGVNTAVSIGYRTTYVIKSTSGGSLFGCGQTASGSMGTNGNPTQYLTLTAIAAGNTGWAAVDASGFEYNTLLRKGSDLYYLGFPVYDGVTGATTSGPVKLATINASSFVFADGAAGSMLLGY